MDPAAPEQSTGGNPEGGPSRRSSARGAVTLMGGTLASRVSGLVRSSILAQFFPPSVADAFLTAFRVPNLFRELLAEGALTNSFVPAYRTLDPAERRRLTGALLGVLAIVNGMLMLLAVVSAPLLARLLISNAEIVDVELTTRLIRVVFPFLPAISLSALAMGILNAEERFLAPAWAPVMLNLVTVALMALYPAQAVPLAVAHVLGGVAQMAIQIPAIARFGLVPRPGRLWHPALGGVMLLMIPFAFTTGGRQILNVITSRLVTDLFSGAPLAFQNADLFLSLMLGLFSISPALAYYSRLSAHAAEAPERFRGTLVEGLGLIAFLTVPAGLALVVFAEPLVELAFNWRMLFGGSLDPAVRAGTVAAVAPLGLAVFPVGVFNLLVRTFYVRRQVALPVGIVVGTLSLQAILYWLLVEPLGIAGLSWGAAGAGWAQLLVAGAVVSSREGLAASRLLLTVLPMWIAGIAASLAGWLAMAALPEPGGWFGWLGTLAAGGCLFALVYAGLTLLLGVPEALRLVRLRR